MENGKLLSNSKKICLFQIFFVSLQVMRRNIYKIICFLSIAMLPYSCKDDDNPYPIPDYTVNFTIDTSSFDMDFNIGDIKTFPGKGRSGSGYFGYLGVVVYYHNQDELYAYDIACPNDHYYGVTIIEALEGAIPAPGDLCIQCPTCKARFSLLNNGYPEGSAYEYPLKKYQVSKIDNHRFLVHN